MSHPSLKWSTAFNRFGLGARGREAPASGDPREALRAELSVADAGLLRPSDLPTTPQAMAIFFAYKDRPKPEATPVAMSAAPAAAVMTPPPAASNPVNDTFQAETRARLEAGTAASIGYVERLTAFWSNHFCVAASKSQLVRILAGAYEREAIRPYVLGRFAPMLRAAESHPAMLAFLDNAQSVGPNSRAGQNGKRGLNENFAREILELHTLGVDGGYSQADVTEFAAMLTGWTVSGRNAKGDPGVFQFNANAHEPGPRRLLGRVYPEGGQAQAEAALDDLARHPATARHIARKFARAFVADDPPSGLVERLTRVFATTDGDLGALAHALVDDDEAWSAPPAKLRDPWQMVMASVRALGLDTSKPGQMNNALALLGQPLWNPAGPNGFSDASDAWLSPEGVKIRVEIAQRFSRRCQDPPAPADLIARVLPDASAESREAILRAESPQQAYALLLLAPEFQRR